MAYGKYNDFFEACTWGLEEPPLQIWHTPCSQVGDPDPPDPISWSYILILLTLSWSWLIMTVVEINDISFIPLKRHLDFLTRPVHHQLLQVEDTLLIGLSGFFLLLNIIMILESLVNDVDNVELPDYNGFSIQISFQEYLVDWTMIT